MIFRGDVTIFQQKVFGGRGALETFPESKIRYKGAIKSFQFVRHLINLYTRVLYTVMCIFLVTQFKENKKSLFNK